MAFANNGGARIHWRREGAAGKPVLVLLTSIGTDMALYDRAAPSLLADFQLLRIDHRGHGASDAPAGEYSLDLLAGDVLAVMDAAGVASAAICGVSLGGMVGMTLALKAPERIDGLVLACTSAAMDVEVWKQRIATVKAQGLGAIEDAVLGRFFSAPFRARHLEVVETTAAALRAQDPEGYCGCGAAIRDMALLDRLPGIDVPTLVIGGRNDISTPFDGHGARIAQAIPGAQTAMLDTAHLPCLEDPLGFAALVRGFLIPNPAKNEANQTLFDVGLGIRRQVLGDAWVDAALAKRTDFNADYQAMITRYAWNEIWGRPGLDHRTRRLLVLAICAALARWEEFRLHVRTGLQQEGFTREELKEVLMQTAIYAGVPAANTAFAEAAQVIAELDAPSS